MQAVDEKLTRRLANEELLEVAMRRIP